MLAAWMGWALLSAGFAALTAIVAKAGVASINPVIALVAAGTVLVVHRG